ncbi:hypothetical protein, partial [Ponticaulis profundi]
KLLVLIRIPEREFVMLTKYLAGALLASQIIVTPAAFAAIPNGSFQRSVQLRAFVPVVCRTTFTADYTTNHGVRSLGSVREFCNSSSGYRVIVEVGGSLEDAGTLYWGGQAFPITSGQIVVTDSIGPARLQRNIGYEPGQNSISQLSIRIEPKYT